MTTYKRRSIHACLAFAAVCLFDGSARAQNYEHGFQEMVGDRAAFHVSGPATGPSPDVEGDAILDHVEFPSGDVYRVFYKPVDVFDIQYWGDDLDFFRVRAGSRTTVGLSGMYHYGAADGDPSDVSSFDVDEFRRLMLVAFQNNNLNNYCDLGATNAARFDFIIEFNMVVKDNDPDADDFGEILYFERGTGAGNSWLKFQAVDEGGTALGPWLVMGPAETVQTTPQTTVMRSDQKVGTTSIDVSRLGVTEFKHLRVSNDLPGEPAYTGGGDLNPDFKIMAVITNEVQLQQVLGMFD